MFKGSLGDEFESSSGSEESEEESHLVSKSDKHLIQSVIEVNELINEMCSLFHMFLCTIALKKIDEEEKVNKDTEDLNSKVPINDLATKRRKITDKSKYGLCLKDL